MKAIFAKISCNTFFESFGIFVVERLRSFVSRPKFGMNAYLRNFKDCAGVLRKFSRESGELSYMHSGIICNGIRDYLLWNKGLSSMELGIVQMD